MHFVILYFKITNVSIIIIVNNKYILLDVLLCSIADYFYKLCRIFASP